MDDGCDRLEYIHHFHKTIIVCIGVHSQQLGNNKQKNGARRNESFVPFSVSIQPIVCISFNEMINKRVYKWSLYRLLCRQTQCFHFHRESLPRWGSMVLCCKDLKRNKHKTVVNYTKSHHDARYPQINNQSAQIFARLFLLTALRIHRILRLLPVIPP